MMRILFGVALLAALLATYWVSPTGAWMALVAMATLTLARYVRHRDAEASQAFQAAEE